MFVSALHDPTCNSERSANGGNKQILLSNYITIKMCSCCSTSTLQNFNPVDLVFAQIFNFL